MPNTASLLRKAAVLGCTHLPVPFLRAVPPLIGGMFYVAQPRHRRGVRENLEALGAPPGRLSELATFVAFARSFSEGLAALGPRGKDARIEVTGEDHFHRIRESGRGCILVTAHTSSFEVAGAALRRATGIEVTMAMRRERNDDAARVSDDVRHHGGLDIVHLDDDPLSLVELARRIRAGGAVGMHIDRAPRGGRSVSAPFLGGVRPLPLGPFALAQATGAPMLPVLTRRTGFLSAEVVAKPPISLPRRATQEQVAEAAAALAGHLEAWLRKYPWDWLDWGEAGEGMAV